MLADAVPDCPGWVSTLRARHDWIVGKVFLEHVQVTVTASVPGPIPVSTSCAGDQPII
jgi:hypothetical protein